jgi:hypothetical protein
VLVFISIGSRRIEHLACTSNPNTAWMLQQARNLLMDLDDREQQVRFLIHDCDAKFPHAFDALLANEKINVIRPPSGRRTRTRTWSAGSAASAENASTGCSSSAAANSSTSSASTSLTTTEGGRTAPST